MSFFSENIRKPNVKFNNKSSKRDNEEVASKETDVLKLLIALSKFSTCWFYLLSFTCVQTITES